MESVLFIGEVNHVAPLVATSVKAGHPTFVLLRWLNFVNPSNLPKIKRSASLGAYFAYGKLNDHQSLVNAIRNVDVVISVKLAVADTDKILSAIREVGDHKKFISATRANAIDAGRGMELENRAPFHNYAPHGFAPVPHAYYQVLPHPNGYYQSTPNPHPNVYYQGVPQPHPQVYCQVPQNYAPCPPTSEEISPMKALLHALHLLGFVFGILQFVGV